MKPCETMGREGGCLLLVIIAFVWSVERVDQPKFSDMTVHEWVEARLNGDVGRVEFSRAISNLGTNFIPVFEGIDNQRQRKWRERRDMAYELLPTILKKNIRIPIPQWKYEDVIREGSVNLEANSQAMVHFHAIEVLSRH